MQIFQSVIMIRQFISDYTWREAMYYYWIQNDFMHI